MVLRRATSVGARWTRSFSNTSRRREIRHVADLPDRIIPRYTDSGVKEHFALQWPAPPRNIFMVKKYGSPAVTESLTEYANHIHRNYDDVSLIFEPEVAHELHESFSFPIYTSTLPSSLANKVDLTTTLGGDGTILHASSFFSSKANVPPILAFSMGTLGFLGEWKFDEYKRAFRELYTSGAEAGSHLVQDDKHPHVQQTKIDDGTAAPNGWTTVRGKSMGPTRSSKVLIRNRLKIGVFDPKGNRISGDNSSESAVEDIHAMNEVLIHRGANPHLAVIEVYVGGRFLTEGVADGMIISTPTGSTAYSLSSGGSIVHPLVSSLLITPICPRSLSFRPLVLPANTPVTLRLSEKNRGRDLEISIDGKRKDEGLRVGMEVRVVGEELTNEDGSWTGGVPCVVRGGKGKVEDDDGWVGGLNGLLKFNYPFGEEE